MNFIMDLSSINMLLKIKNIFEVQLSFKILVNDCNNE